MSLNTAQALRGPNLFRESTVKKPSTFDQKLADLKIAELPTIQRVQAKQQEMLQLLKQAHVDPLSYVGLEYCNPDHCGRVNCSEACWFGTLRRRIPEVLAIRQLMDKQEGTLNKIAVWKPVWDCPFEWLHYIKPGFPELRRLAYSTACAACVLLPLEPSKLYRPGLVTSGIFAKFTRSLVVRLDSKSNCHFQ
jgi:hypothetical protein